MKNQQKGIYLTTVILLLLVAVHGGFAQGQSAETGKESGSTGDGLSWIEKDSIRFEWQVQGDSLYCKAEAPTTGWVAIGFDPDRMMKGANIIIGYIKGGTVEIEDHFGTAITSHKGDTDIGGSRDLTVKGGTERNGTTTLEFTIPLNSGDSKDKVLRKGEEYKIILAYGRNNADDYGSIHRKRTSVTITL